MQKPRPVVYVWHEEFTKESDSFIPTESRNEMVHCLIESYGLLDKMNVVSPRQTTVDDLKAFHSADYLERLNSSPTDSLASDDDDEYGLGYDCPKKDGIMTYCLRVAGGTTTAAKLLGSRTCDVAIHWLGGWHHAKRSNASGYCYVNDCVLGIIQLREKFQRVLYVDLDLHHGDGVEEAFAGTGKVATLSFHKYEPGFFPGTGSLIDDGFGKGKNFSINVPLLDGIKDSNYISTFDKIFPSLVENFQPGAILCQCGADGMNEDPMRSFNLTQQSLVHCVKQILKLKLPTLLTGGGGYHSANTARCWASITATVTGECVSEDIPEHIFFDRYGPHFELSIPEGMRKDLNSKSYLEEVVGSVLKTIKKMKSTNS